MGLNKNFKLRFDQQQQLQLPSSLEIVDIEIFLIQSSMVQVFL